MAENRVTQHRIEVLAQPDANARVTQHRIEVLAVPPSVPRVTQHRIEVLLQNPFPIAQPPMRVGGIIGG